jgi:hypothetical protein
MPAHEDLRSAALGAVDPSWREEKSQEQYFALCPKETFLMVGCALAGVCA